MKKIAIFLMVLCLILTTVNIFAKNKFTWYGECNNEAVYLEKTPCTSCLAHAEGYTCDGNCDYTEMLLVCSVSGLNKCQCNSASGGE